MSRVSENSSIHSINYAVGKSKGKLEDLQLKGSTLKRVSKPSDIVELGQEMDFKVLRIDPENRRIGLSARAVGRDDEPVINTKTYSSQVGSGMASLGELADFGMNRNAPAELPEPVRTEAAAPVEASSREDSESEESEETKSQASSGEASES